LTENSRGNRLEFDNGPLTGSSRHAVPIDPLPRLRAFTAVARWGSFSAAARQLGVSTPAISKAVRQLEDQLGVVLVKRTSRSVALTEIGERLLQRSGAPLEEALEGMRDLEHGHDAVALTGTIRITAPEMVTELFLVPVVASFLASHPRVVIEIHVENRPVDIVREGYDAGVRMDGIPKDMVRVRICEPFRLVVVSAPSYLERYGEPKKPEDLHRHRGIGRHGHGSRDTVWELEKGKRIWKLRVPTVFSCNERAARIAAAVAGVGLAHVVDLHLAALVERGDLRVVLGEYARRMPGCFFYYPSRRQASTTFRAFVDAFQRGRPPSGVLQPAALHSS
jgi:DNA-binding transcriptional LysR family regulator